MQHMDEGLLQAWMDGPRGGLSDEERVGVEAHLDECSVCQERLETLRLDGERAMELLAAVEQVDDEIPDFAAVLQRARELDRESEGEAVGGTVGSAGSGREPPTERGEAPDSDRSALRPAASTSVRPWFGRRTAWAASIMVALGAGWLANEWNTPVPDVRLDPLQVTESPASATPVESAAAAEAGAAMDEGALESSAPDLSAAAGRANRIEAAEEEAFSQDLPSALADASAAPDTLSATSGTGAEAGAAAERRVAEAPQAREVGAQASRLAPPPAEGDPVVQLNATPVPQRTSVSGRVVDAASGSPLVSAQVIVPGTNVGTLTNADGRFLLFPGTSQDSVAQLRVEIVGYRAAEFSVELTDDEVAVGDVALDQTAVVLDQLVAAGAGGADEALRIAGFSAAMPSWLNDDRWMPASLAEARDHLGAAPGTVPDLPVTAVRVATLDGLAVVEVKQELQAGAVLTLIQTRSAAPLGEEELGNTTQLPSGVFVQGWADVPPDSLRALLARVRAN